MSCVFPDSAEMNPPASTVRPNIRQLRAAGLIVLLTVAAFAGSMKAGFVNWDDNLYVYDNPLVQHPSWRGCWNLLSGFQQHFYIPLVFLSYCADSLLWQGKAAGYHFTNLALHAASGLVLVFVYRWLLKSTSAAFVAAAIHQLHPLRVESVGWITERKDVLCLFFYVLSVFFYLRYGDSGRRGSYALSALACVLAMASKPTAMTLPFLLVLVDWQTRGAIRLRDKWPHFLIATVFSALSGLAQSRAEVIRPLHGGSALGHAVAVGRLFVFYLSKIAFPTHLSCKYVFMNIASANASGWACMLGAAVLVAACIAGLRRRRPAAAGFAAYCLMLAPVSNLIPITILAADRYTYLASLGLSAAAACILWSACRGGRWRNACLLTLLCLLCALTIRRIPVWKNGEALWADALRKGHFSAIVWNNYASALFSAKRLHRAKQMARRALEVDPKSVSTYRLLGNIWQAEGDASRAAYFYRLAARSPKAQATDYYNLGFVLMVLGDHRGAVTEFRRALSMAPDLHVAQLALGDVFFASRRLAESERAYRKAMASAPRDVAPRLGLAKALEARGRLREAEQHCRVALQIDPDNVAALNRLARLFAQGGHLQAAESLMRKALRADPSVDGTYVNLGNLLVLLRRFREAKSMYQTALRLRPDNKQAARNLQALLKLIGRPPRSVRRR